MRIIFWRNLLRGFRITPKLIIIWESSGWNKNDTRKLWNYSQRLLIWITVSKKLTTILHLSIKYWKVKKEPLYKSIPLVPEPSTNIWGPVLRSDNCQKFARKESPWAMSTPPKSSSFNRSKVTACLRISKEFFRIHDDPWGRSICLSILLLREKPAEVVLNSFHKAAVFLTR